MKTTRRRYLQGAGASLALPWLESVPVFAEETPGAQLPPVRYFNCYFGNGLGGDWSATNADGQVKLGNVLEDLSRHQEYCTVITGLRSTGLNHHGLGHYLSGSKGRGKGMPDLKGMPHAPQSGAPWSIDQVFADAWAGSTEIPCLVLGCEPTKGNGGETNISWRVGTPLPKEVDPGAAFDSLFNGPVKRRRARSVLDFVAEDLKRLNVQASVYDRHRLDEFGTSIREVERRLDQAAKPRTDGYQAALREPDLRRPGGTPPLPDYMRLMMDISLLALRMNKTRVITLMWSNELSKLDFGFVEQVKGNLHGVSHGAGGVRGAHEMVTRFHVAMFSEFLDKCRTYTEGDRSLLDSMAIHFGSIMRQGSQHSQQDIPCILAGKAGGALRGNRAIDAKDRLLGEVNLALARRLGFDLERFGEIDSAIDL